MYWGDIDICHGLATTGHRVCELDLIGGTNRDMKETQRDRVVPEGQLSEYRILNLPIFIFHMHL